MICVLMLGSGRPWEPVALGLCEQEPDLVVLRRCVDVEDLLAAGAAGQAHAAVVGLDVVGLDPDAVRILAQHGVAVLGVAPDLADEDLLVRAAHAGVQTVLAADDLSGLAEELRGLSGPEPEADSELEDVEATPAPGRGGRRLLAVWGPAGAPGRTTTAVALAGLLAARGKRTVLVDADPWAPAVAQQLGILEESSGLLAAARAPATPHRGERVDGCARALSPHLWVLTGLPRPERWSEVGPGSLGSVLDEAATRGYVVVDTGAPLEGGDQNRGGRNALTLTALRAADEWVVVGTPDPVGLTRLAHGLVELRETFGPRPVRVVLNRMRPTLGWSAKDVTGMVEGFARLAGLHVVPEDREGLDRALSTGRGLAELPDTPAAQAFQLVVDALVGPGSGPGTGRRRRSLRRRTAGTARPR